MLCLFTAPSCSNLYSSVHKMFETNCRLFSKLVIRKLQKSKCFCCPPECSDCCKRNKYRCMFCCFKICWTLETQSILHPISCSGDFKMHFPEYLCRLALNGSERGRHCTSSCNMQWQSMNCICLYSYDLDVGKPMCI